LSEKTEYHSPVEMEEVTALTERFLKQADGVKLNVSLAAGVKFIFELLVFMENLGEPGEAEKMAEKMIDLFDGYIERTIP